MTPEDEELLYQLRYHMAHGLDEHQREIWLKWYKMGAPIRIVNAMAVLSLLPADAAKAEDIEFLRVPNFGRKSLQQLREGLRQGIYA
jgi:hypothetical protein